VAGLALVEHDHGVTWVYDEFMERASHALVVDGAVWLIDPVDDPEGVAAAQALGPIAGVIQLLDRHDRDGEALAARFDVPYLRLPREVPGTPLQVVPVQWRVRWHELALWWPQESLLVVPEAVGTAEYFTAGTGPVGLHPFLRLCPPAPLRRFAPEHLLVGHGEPVRGEDARGGLPHALARGTRDFPRLVATLARRHAPLPGR
jgi:hypothetical protein